ncbi:hypothetical protein B0H19DRAFT_1171458 [Mycena capillaripes]|nr:hypothetical protein B0H19DRAFT_1171458 [Mycena capillaripes]
MPQHRPTTAEKLAYFASQMRVADPSVDTGAFSLLTTSEAMSWIMAIGHINEIDPRLKYSRDPKRQHDIATENLRVALWDIQRFDYLFPTHQYSNTPNFNVAGLETWPLWKTPHLEVHDPALWTEDAQVQGRGERMNSYVVTHFNLMPFTELELAKGHFDRPPEGTLGNWIGTKKIMSHAGLDITECGSEIPFLMYFHEDIMLIMEVLEVKRVPWPQPRLNVWKKLVVSQTQKYGPYRGGPLIPSMQTPKVPLVLVRYSYTEGCPKGGSKFMLYLESRLREILPPGTSDDDVRVELERQITSAQQIPQEHLLMLARLLSYNSGLIDPSWVNAQQAHVSDEVKMETRISFFVPCLRPRFKAIEEIETGLKPMPYRLCGECKRTTNGTICGTCKAVFYCNPSCARKHWRRHKIECKASLQIINAPSALSRETFYIPVRAFSHWVADFGFANEIEAVRLGSPDSMTEPVNEYGTKRFICRVVWGKRLEGKIPYHNERMWIRMTIFDRRRSVVVSVDPKKVHKAKDRGKVIPFHEIGYQRFLEVIHTHGSQGQSMYVWVRRVGDCIEVDLKNIPEQSTYHWE